MKKIHPKHFSLFPAIALLVLVLSAFREPGNQLRPRRTAEKQAFSHRDNCIRNPADTGGRTVRLDSAQACIDRFAELMKNHGFSDVAGQRVNIRIRRTSMITTGESFQGQGLLDWLTQTKAQYDAAGKTLMVNIQLGVYDSSYLNTYQPDPALRSKYLNRIAIFIVPYAAPQAAPQGVHPNIAPPPPPPGGGTGYDLGGIYP
jgi:hypothetical protein